MEEGREGWWGEGGDCLVDLFSQRGEESRPSQNLNDRPNPS